MNCYTINAEPKKNKKTETYHGMSLSEIVLDHILGYLLLHLSALPDVIFYTRKDHLDMALFASILSFIFTSLVHSKVP